MLKREVIVTADGSSTIYIPEWNEHYHSKHGAIQEANYVYLDKGLKHYIESNTSTTTISVLEIGFGTGLNAFLTYLQTKIFSCEIDYTAIEAFPVTNEELQTLKYPELLNEVPESETFNKLHTCNWGTKERISDTFSLTKQLKTFDKIDAKNSYDVVYFDAFGPRVQPELWQASIFEKVYKAMKPEGVLTTYCAKGDVRRTLIEVGFVVERLDGPPGKRHMLRAEKR